MPALCLLGWDADDRGYHIPAQIDLLGPVKQGGLELVEVETKIAEHHEGSADVERVGRASRLAADRLDHRINGLKIVRRPGRHLPGVMPAAHQIAGGKPGARVIHDVWVWRRDLVAEGWKGSGSGGGNAVCFVCEHGQPLLPRVTGVAALLDR